MPDLWLAPDHLFDGKTLLTGHAVRVADGQIIDLAAAPANATPLRGCLTPGFVDLQVNGGGGVLLNTTPTPQGMATIATAHRAFGTVALMPTVITDHADVLDQAADAAIAAEGTSGLMGLHIEGPHIALAKRGTHAAEHIRPLDDRTLATVQRLRDGGVATLITLAPEAATPAQISQLAAMGAIVSLGHTDASADAMETAIAAGATCATHLFNAMSQMQGRAPGAVGAILTSNIHAGLICDGHHVDDRMIRLALQATSGTDRLFLVSDAMATVGGPDHFDLYGQTIRVDQGRLINAEGNLAGAHTTMAQGVQRLVNNIGTDLARVLRMAITTPATLMGQPERASLIGLPTSDAILLGDDLAPAPL